MPGENIQDWSTTAANNATADTLIGWAEGMARAAVNDSARSMMAAIAKDRNLKNGSITTAGTANAQTFMSGLTYTAVPTGLLVRLKIGAGLTNTAAATLNVDGIGAVAIKYPDGTDIDAGALIESTYCEFLYNGTNWIALIGRASKVRNVVLSTTTITTPVATVEFTGLTSAFEQYVILITNFVPVDQAVEFWLQVTTDGGATWKTASDDYRWTFDVLWDGVQTWAGYTYAGATGDAAVRLTGEWLNNIAANPLSGEVRVFAPHLAAVNLIEWSVSFRDYLEFTDICRGGGGYRLDTAVNGIRFLCSSGDINSGVFTLQGVKAP